MRKISLIVFVLFSCFCGIGQNPKNVEGALMKMEEGHIQECILDLESLNAMSDVVSYFIMGWLYENGYGVDMNLRKAFLLYRKAAEKGLPEAQKALSDIYVLGKGIEANIDKSEYWSNKCEGKYNPQVMEMLEAIYLKGKMNQDKIATELAQNSNNENQNAVKDNNVVSVPKENSLAVTPEEIEAPVFISDIDAFVPTSEQQAENTFAVIFANQNYQDLEPVLYSLNDGESMMHYFVSALGIPSDHVHFVKDATLNNMKKELNWLTKVADRYEGEASCLIYYSGHGIPDDVSRNAYLLPIDAFTGDLSTGYKLEDLYALISNHPFKQSIILLDACFSGANRDAGMLVSSRGVRIAPKGCQDALKGNTIVFSATKDDEAAYPFREQEHGLFTYYFLKGCQTNPQAPLGELFNFVIDNVSKKSLIVNGKPQTPTVAVPKAGVEWETFTIVDK